MPNFCRLIILVGLTMTIFSDEMLISHRCIRGLMPNLIRKSWTVSNAYSQLNPYGNLCGFSSFSRMVKWEKYEPICKAYDKYQLEWAKKWSKCSNGNYFTALLQDFFRVNVWVMHSGQFCNFCYRTKRVGSLPVTERKKWN